MVILDRLIPDDAQPQISYDRGQPEAAFTDWSKMDALHQTALSELFRLGIIIGSGAEFGYSEQLMRCDGCTMLMRVLKLLDDNAGGQEKTVTVRLADAYTGNLIASETQADYRIRQNVTWYDYFLEDLDYNYSYVEPMDSVSLFCDTYTIYCKPKTQAERTQDTLRAQLNAGVLIEE